MLLEDARQLTLDASQELFKQRKALKMPKLRIQDLQEFAAEAGEKTLKREQMEDIVEQAIALIDQMYAHLAFKRARYAVNPVQKLRLLRGQLSRITDGEFHAGMLDAFTELRDAHTYYGLPRPYRDKLAFLPFQVATYGPPGQRRFVVVEVMEGFKHKCFQRGSEVTRWNGTPMETALLRMADHTPGATPDASFARAMGRLTLRLLEYTLPPDEDMVFVEYIVPSSNEHRVIALPWQVAEGWGSRLFVKGIGLSMNAPLIVETQGRKLLWQRAQLYLENKWGPYPKLSDETQPQTPKPAGKPVRTDLPATFEARLLPTPDGKGTVGHLRVKDFAPSPDEFPVEFAALLRNIAGMRARGLILDIRGNPGGDLRSAELVLQYLTPQRITPARFHYVNSPLTQEIADIVTRRPANEAVRARDEFDEWVEDLAHASASADAVTSGRHITPEEDANDTGQIYQQPVVLLTDATVYSAAEIFAGGFLDHEIGPVLGMAETTGGGGANRWDHEELVSKLGTVPGLPLAPLPSGSTLRKLPKFATISLAVRRSSRVGAHAGDAIEDVGLQPTVPVHHPTLADIMEDDRDLMAEAIQLVLEQKSFLLQIENFKLMEQSLVLDLLLRNVMKVEGWVDGELIGAVWPGETLTDLDKTQTLPVGIPLLRRRPSMKRLQLLGYDVNGKLAVATSAQIADAQAS